MIRTIFLSLVASIALSSCTSQYAVEDELYTYIQEEFSKDSLDLESTLDTLELLFIEEELIGSAAPADYRNYYQQNIDDGELRLPQSEKARKLLSRRKFSYQELEVAALRKVDGETFDQSKFGRISQHIESETLATGQITSGTVAKAHLDILSADDFEHPFYRANILLSLQGLYFNHYVKNERYLRPIPKKVETLDKTW